ncbi:hypothetical protein [Klebsiella aerogenes]|uniref:hypothetical protein n=1 Tax=Klebsiella aerogenes TaxID=548 RepID=UPI003F56123A
MTDITELAQQELAQLRAELSNQAIGSKDHLRKIALSLVDKLEKCRDREIRWLALSDEKSKIITDQEEALEKAQKSNEFLKDQLSELANFNPDWDKLEASYESWREIAAELLVAKERIAELESRTVTVKLPEGDERDDLVISITEEIAHLQRCVERYRKEGMASTTQDMEQRLLVQKIALSALNSADGIKWEAE